MLISWSFQNASVRQRAEKAVQGIQIPRDSLAYLLGSVAVMLEAGMTIGAALDTVAENSPDPRVLQLCRELAADVKSGLSLSKAAGRHPRTFCSYHLVLLRIGEAGLRLPSVLHRLARLERRMLRTLLKVRSSLNPPLLILCGCGSGLALAPPLLLEPHFELMRELEIQIPLVTQALMEFSSWMQTPWPYLFATVMVACSTRALLALLANSAVVGWATRCALRVPHLSHLVRGMVVARFARPLAELLRQGAPLTEALHALSRSTGNPVVREEIETVADGVLRGCTLSAALRSASLFCGLPVDGNHDLTLLDGLADAAEEQMKSGMAGVVAVAEPTILSGMGMVVSTMVLGTMLPLSKALDAL